MTTDTPMVERLDRMERLLIDLIARTRRDLESRQTCVEPDIAAIIYAERSQLYANDFGAPPLPPKENQD